MSGAVDQLAGLGAVAAARLIVEGRVSAEELTRACLQRIEAREPEVQAWAFLDPEHALRQAHGVVPLARADIGDAHAFADIGEVHDHLRLVHAVALDFGGDRVPSQPGNGPVSYRKLARGLRSSVVRRLLLAGAESQYEQRTGKASGQGHAAP